MPEYRWRKNISDVWRAANEDDDDDYREEAECDGLSCSTGGNEKVIDLRVTTGDLLQMATPELITSTKHEIIG